MRIWHCLRNSKNNPDTMGPITKRLKEAKVTLNDFPDTKQWFCGGYRSMAIAAELLLSKKIIALPTDTIYGLAGLAQDDKTVSRLYEIKNRDENKPLAICLWNVDDIKNWAHVENLPEGLISALLPGPTTVILKRKGTLNLSLNPGVKNVGIRIPNNNFVRSVVRMVNQPIALTSANESGQKSSLHPTEFEGLWPELDGIFFEKMNKSGFKEFWRNGSTIVDLSVKGEYFILRRGIGYWTTLKTLSYFNLKNRSKPVKEGKEETKKISEESDNILDKATAHASG